MIATLALVNAKAISLMERGMNQEAVRTLLAAVKQCASALFDSQSQPASPRDISCDGILVAVPVHFNQNVLSQREADFFASPFVPHFNEVQESKNVNSQALLSRCIAICFYNMGLACQMEWLQRSRNDSRVLQQAHRFYGKAYSTLQLCEMTRTDSLLVVLMATSSNLIAINMELGQLESLNSLKENLTLIISYADLYQFSNHSGFRELYNANLLLRSDLVAAGAA